MLSPSFTASLPQPRWSPSDATMMVGETFIGERCSPAGSGWEEDRYEWVLACASRLSELRPDEDKNFIASVASDMWMDVGSHDPEVAAEMEHESWPWED